MSTLRRGTVEPWSAAQLSNDEVQPRFHEAFKANGNLQGLHRSDAVQIFRARARHTLLLSDRARHSWSATTVGRLRGEREQTVLQVLSECRKSASVHLSGWAAISVKDDYPLAAGQGCHDLGGKHNAEVSNRAIQ
ncbi:hypothetical protein PoB_004366100 [Plakobranchus ocellatus]|uniref:Uncharacterized protein n=1 Tax=Plakobranchus ocellatus TaxID=259542 RepID=A0AAV4B195_9GAST|nr:hypothetical protein PoB_004366100 [Plakobranchus ocellatus]